MSTSLRTKFAAFMQLAKAKFLCLTENMGGVSEHKLEHAVLYCLPGTDNFLNNININKRASR